MSCQICESSGYIECPACRPEPEPSIWIYFDENDNIVDKSDNWVVREDLFGNEETNENEIKLTAI